VDGLIPRSRYHAYWAEGKREKDGKKEKEGKRCSNPEENEERDWDSNEVKLHESLISNYPEACCR